MHLEHRELNQAKSKLDVPRAYDVKKDGCKIFWTYYVDQSITNVLCIVSTNLSIVVLNTKFTQWHDTMGRLVCLNLPTLKYRRIRGDMLEVPYTKYSQIWYDIDVNLSPTKCHQKVLFVKTSVILALFLATSVIFSHVEYYGEKQLDQVSAL